MGPGYDDDYPTCARTYATLRIYPGLLDPAIVTERLGLDPSGVQRVSDARQAIGRRPGCVPLNGWFLSTKGLLKSKDTRRHLDLLLERIGPKKEALHSLRSEGARMDISCFWASEEGHGGPTISPAQMGMLAELDLELWIDLY